MPAPVRGLNQRENGEWDVETDHGTIHAKHIVNAAGIDRLYSHTVKDYSHSILCHILSD